MVGEGGQTEPGRAAAAAEQEARPVWSQHCPQLPRSSIIFDRRAIHQISLGWYSGKERGESSNVWFTPHPGGSYRAWGKPDLLLQVPAVIRFDRRPRGATNHSSWMRHLLIESDGEAGWWGHATHSHDSCSLNTFSPNVRINILKSCCYILLETQTMDV